MKIVHFGTDGRDNNLHFIRHLAALAVVLTHSYSILTGQYASEPLVNLMGTSIGHYALDVFFILSGFVVTQSLAREFDLVRFATSRILRIFPALIVAVLATTFLLGPLVTTLSFKDYFADQQTWLYVVGAISTLGVDANLPGVFAAAPEAGAVNLPLWTLKYELWAYFLLSCLAIVAVTFNRRAVAAAIAGLAVIYVIGRILFPYADTESAIGNGLHLTLAFFLGSCGYLLRRRIPLTPLIALPLFGLAYAFNETVAYEFLEKILIAYTLLWLAFLKSLRFTDLSRFGDISYGIYIYAFPIQQAIRQIIPDIQPLELFTITLVVTVPVSMLSWHFIEEPFLRCRKWIVPALRQSLDFVRRRAEAQSSLPLLRAMASYPNPAYRPNAQTPLSPVRKPPV